MARLTPSDALDELTVQHAVLREMIERCDALADEVDVGMTEPGALAAEVARLRTAFDEHNRFEEQLLHPLLADVEWLGAVRVSRMVEDHVEEHRAMQRGLAATPTAELRRVLVSLGEHLTSEERYLLSRRVLSDDLER